MTDDRVRDAEFVARWKAGDELAFQALYDAWFDRAFDLARRYVDRDLAGEVVQEAFITALGHLSELRDDASFGAWLLRIVRNRAIDRVRRERRTVSVDDPARVGDGEVERRAVEVSDPERVALDSELAALVWDSVDALGERDADVITLHVRHGLEPSEIGEVLGVDRVHAAQLLHRSRQRLGDAIRARVLWRGGNPSCAVLAAELQPAGIEAFDGIVARRITRHARDCESCQDQQRTALAPAALFGAIPLVVPAGLREQVWAGVHSRIADAAVTSTSATSTTSATSATGRATTAGRRAARAATRTKAIGAIAATAAVAATATAIVATRSEPSSPALTSAVESARPTSPLVDAAYDGDRALVERLLGEGATPDATDSDGRSALHAAAFAGNVGIVELLIDAGADPNARDDSGATALHLAATFGLDDVAEALLRGGADPKLTDQLGRSAAAIAREQGNDELAAHLDKVSS